MKTRKLPFTADVIVSFEDSNDNRYVLLVKRGNNPYKGMWALPGGHVEEDETLLDAAQRELKEETGIEMDKGKLVFMNIYDDPDRHPLKRTMTSVYFTFIDDVATIKEVVAGDDAKDIGWFRIDKLPELAFDHLSIIRDFTQEQCFI